MKGLCRIALAALFVAACGRDSAITGVEEPTAPPPVSGGILALGVDSTTGASIETNKDDYSPGEVVHLVGRGWAPGETVNLHMTESPNTHADVDTNVVADAAGGFSIHFYDVQVHDAGVAFTLTATGGTSNSVAVAVFTDGSLRVRTNSALYVVTISWELFGVGNTTCSGTGTPGSTPNVDSDGNNQIVNIEADRSIKLTAPASAAGQPFVRWLGFPDGQQTICVAGTQNTQHWDVIYNLAPTANAGGPYSGSEGSAIPLDGSLSTDGEGTISSYAWSSTTVTADAGASCTITPNLIEPAKPTISCNDDGSYQVQLTVTDNHGSTSSQAVATLTVSNVAPTATFAATPSSVSVGGAFTLSLTSPLDAGSNDLGANLRYSFDCGTGVFSAFSTSNSIGCTGTVQPTQTVKGRISDQDGGITEYTLDVSVTVANVGPTAEANGPYSGFTNTAIALNGAGSTDSDGNITSYAWSYTVTSSPDGGTCSIANSPSNLPNAATVSCTQDGTYEVKLTVTDDDGATDDDVATLTINNKAPTANAGGPYNNKLEGSSVALNGSGTDTDGTIASYLWTYDVISTDPNGDCVITGATLASASIVCDDDGSFTVTLKVTDDDGATNEQTVALTVVNANPVATINGPYSGAEGEDVDLTGSGNDPGDNDDGSLSYLWSVNSSGITNGGTCTVDNATSATLATVSCTDNGTATLSLQVSDGDGGSHTASVGLTVNNANPGANAYGDYVGAEGGNVSLTGSFTDAGSNDTHTFKWTYVAGAGVHVDATCTFNDDTALSPTVNCTDNGTFTLTLKVTDDDGGVDTDDAKLTLSNAAPSVTITSPADYSIISLLNGPISVSATYTDAGANDTHECEVFLDGAIDVLNDYSPVPASPCNRTILPVEAGLYDLTVRIRDDDGSVGSATINIIVYDPSAGFVTGGGWINSPAGAYIANPLLTGKANFGFVSKYKRGATVPEGNTEFQFHAGSLNFHSSSYEFLIVNQAGSNAQFKGKGKINGAGNYTFMLWATDGGNSNDKFRIKITDDNDGDAVVYDNGILTAAEQLIAGGSIVIHTGGKK